MTHTFTFIITQQADFLDVDLTPHSSGVSVTSTKGKLDVSMKHYRGLGTCTVDTAFDDSWKEEVDKKVSEFSSLSADDEGSVLDR